MRLIEVRVKMGANGIIKLSEEEINKMGLEENDDICLTYLSQNEVSQQNKTGEFIIEKK